MSRSSAVATQDAHHRPSRPPRPPEAQLRRVGRGSVSPFGNEPPLEYGSPVVSATRHGPSLRWLGASVLTGVAGALLLGAAIYVAAQGQITFADKAERAQVGAVRPSEAGPAGLRKGDKLVRAETVAAAKQAFKAPMTLRAGDREVIRIRNFTRIATGLSLTTGVYATAVPPFDPMRFFAADPAERGAEPPTETSDADVSVVKSDLAAIVLEPGGPTLSDAEVAVQLAGEARQAGSAGGPAALPLVWPLSLRALPARAGGPALALPRASASPFRGIEVQVVQENVTRHVKSEGRTSDLSHEDRAVPIRRGETVEAILRAGGATADDARLIVTALGTRERTAVSLEGMQVRLLLAPPPQPGEARALVRAILFGERGVEAIAARNDRGAFVSVSLPPADPGRAQPRRSGSDEDGEDDDGAGVRLYESLYETALKHDLSRGTVEELIRIFGYDVDFQRRVAPGDGFELFYATDEEGGDRIEILSATLTLGSEVRRVYRFAGEDGTIDYLDEQGRSLKKFLLRKPIVDAKLTSGYGSRFHPILGYTKMHSGVDWAGKNGTPIFSAGNGTLIKAEWDSGYGRRIEVQHANGYVTTYNHMSAFGRGMAPGARVRQGQVIGYVGSTGLSTGPHLHYEVKVNGIFVDPMKIKVPRGRELDGRALADYARQREQIDALTGRAGTAPRLARAAEAR